MISHKQKILASAGIFFVVSVAGAVSVAKAVSMPSAFIAALFEWLTPFLASPFNGYAV